MRQQCCKSVLAEQRQQYAELVFQPYPAVEEAAEAQRGNVVPATLHSGIAAWHVVRHKPQNVEARAEKAALHGTAVFGRHCGDEAFEHSEHIEAAGGEVPDDAVGPDEVEIEVTIGDSNFVDTHEELIDYG